MRLNLLFLCLLAVVVPAEAASVSGVVVDASGAPVRGATVTIGTASVMTDDAGEFAIDNAPDGVRTIQVSAAGFAVATVAIDADNVNGTRVILQPAPLVAAVVVTASRGAERLSTASGTTVLTSAELLNSAGGALDDVLRNTPGFSLFRRSSSRVSNPTTQGVTLRGVSGSGASRTLVLADGVPLNDPFGSWVYWNRVPQAAVDRVEVVRGATGDLYGADALGGVVQVLTFAPGRNRLRATVDGGSHATGRFSGYGSTQRNGWSIDGSAEWLRTDGVVIIGEEVRGPIDVRADSDYVTGFLTAAYNPGVWHASARLNGYSEERGNGTPAQVNTTGWTQLSGEAGGSAAQGAWLVRGSGGTQDYYQTFSAVAADRASERLTMEQTIPSSFGNLSGQWSRGFGASTLLLGGEGRWTSATVEEIRYSLTNVRSGPFLAGGKESLGAMFGRVSVAPLQALTLVVGVRGDFWRSEPEQTAATPLPTHTANFLSPRVSASYTLSDTAALHAAVYRAHRTPTLNELHRGFRVGNALTNPNPLLDPEELTGFEGGVLLTQSSRLSTRLTAFWNKLEGGVTNVTISSTPALITRERQNTDTVRAAGFELEADFRPSARWTFSGLVGVTRSTFTDTPKQPAIEGNRVPQVPSFQLGGSATYTDPRGFTGAVQARGFGSQFDDDLNTPAFELDGFGVVDASATQELVRGLNVFIAIENLFDADYDVGRTPIRTIGWPRTVRMGARVFLP
jgi:outer membrane receptor protein involved in Fe transport